MSNDPMLNSSVRILRCPILFLAPWASSYLPNLDTRTRYSSDRLICALLQPRSAAESKFNWFRHCPQAGSIFPTFVLSHFVPLHTSCSSPLPRVSVIRSPSECVRIFSDYGLCNMITREPASERGVDILRIHQLSMFIIRRRRSIWWWFITQQRECYENDWRCVVLNFIENWQVVWLGP